MRTVMSDTLQSKSTDVTSVTPQFEIFRQLKTLTSVKDKEEALRAVKDDDYIAELIHRNLNPYMMFHIKEIPEYVANPQGKQGAENYRAFIKLTDKLNKREITGNAAKEAVRQFFMESHAEDAGYYETILTKSPIGVRAKTVNKVWPKLVPNFDLMLAPNQLPIVTQLTWPRYVQPKLDDYRTVYNQEAFYSRSGKSFANKNLPGYFSKLFQMNDYVLDGGLYAHGITFNKLQTILNNKNAPLPYNLKFHVWDAMPVQDWERQKCNLPYEERLKLVRKILNNIVADYQKVIDIPNDIVNSSKEAVDLYKKYLKDGYEGSMIKRPDGLYQWKRVTLKSGEILKQKPYKSIDLEVESIYAGEGDHEGMAGGIVVDFKGVKVRCGSGFDDETLTDMIKNPDEYIGKVAEIRYLEVTEDGSLRHPSFKDWREDKENEG